MDQEIKCGTCIHFSEKPLGSNPKTNCNWFLKLPLSVAIQGYEKKMITSEDGKYCSQWSKN